MATNIGKNVLENQTGCITQLLHKQTVQAGAVALSDQAECESPGKLLDNNPMEGLFRSLKNEWVPESGYSSSNEVAHAITDYIVEYYSSLRPHEYNGGIRGLTCGYNYPFLIIKYIDISLLCVKIEFDFISARYANRVAQGRLFGVFYSCSRAIKYPRTYLQCFIIQVAFEEVMINRLIMF